MESATYDGTPLGMYESMKHLKVPAVVALALFVSTSAMALRPAQPDPRSRPAGSVIDGILNRAAPADRRNGDDARRKASKEQDKRDRKRAQELRKQEQEREKAIREDRREREKDAREAAREREKDTRKRDRITPP